MKVVLAAVNAKYIHSNPAIYSLRAAAGRYKEQIELAEYTINHTPDAVLQDLYLRRPDVLALSCYIWNISFVRQVVREFHKLCPAVPIWVGGPEVSYEVERWMDRWPELTGIFIGEGEQSFARVVEAYVCGSQMKDCEMAKEAIAQSLRQIEGLCYRNHNGERIFTDLTRSQNFAALPFYYEEMDSFANRVVYYESSRGCPFSCSYCLSSIDKTVRFREMEQVKKELLFFIERKVPQVKFIDRTFNCNHKHAITIWKFLKEHDNGVTNFHFEISADLLNAEELDLLTSLRPGMVQLEIGVQTWNMQTLEEIRRKTDLKKLAANVRRIRQAECIHCHLDLIAGLPYEDFESFGCSFNQVFALRPHQLQLGFLKVLKGSYMSEQAEAYGLVYQSRPPYEVLCTKWISYDEIIRLKAIEEVVEQYYNTCQFAHTLELVLRVFESPFVFFDELGAYYMQHEQRSGGHSRMERYNILRKFLHEKLQEQTDVSLADENVVSMSDVDEALITDLYARENLKSRAVWMPDLTAPEVKAVVHEFYRQEKATPQYLQGYEQYSISQMKRMTHLEVFGDHFLLFEYQHRNALTGNVKAYRIDR